MSLHVRDARVRCVRGFQVNGEGMEDAEIDVDVGV